MQRQHDFSHHEECPKCRERGEDSRGDNLGVWKDGHKHCFKCSYFVPANALLCIEAIAGRLYKNKKKESNGSIIYLPDDFSDDIPQVGLDWLYKYGITDNEITWHHIGWTQQNESLVFPVFDCNGSLLMYQNRRFGGTGQRYFTSGLPEKVYHIIGNSNNTITVVEDFISAIKVYRVAKVMPLWGSTISPNRIKVLSDRFTNLVIWLDKDKASYAIKRAQAAKPFFDDVRVVVTELDPKCYTTEEIKEILDGET